MNNIIRLVHIGLLVAATAVADGKKPSILFVNIDDLNDWNSVLQGHPQAITPNIQRLADQGVTFSRAICSSPVCYPSRTSMFSGIHPVRSGAISNFNWGKPWRFYVNDAVTIPKHFSNNGWTTYGAAKNFHGGNKAEFDHDAGQHPDPKPLPGTGHSYGPIGWGIADCSYEEMGDYKTASWAIEKMADADEASFFSIGIYKPHVKWILPQSCFDAYPLDTFQLPAIKEDDLDDLPERLKLLAHNEAKFGKGYHEMLKEAGQDKHYARAYIASVTFADEQLGRLLDAWEASPMSKDGYIVLWSDHGFMLGEKEGWCKFKPWLDASHSNLIFAGPGIPKGEVRDQAVSLLDIYPTLVELFNLPEPDVQKLDGCSLVPLLRDSEKERGRPVVMSHEEDGIRYDSVMDNRFRMTRLITGETELYDHSVDPHEWTNIALRAESAEVIKRLERSLTFSHPIIPEDGWIEAEKIPTQTSADRGRRGNYHYRWNDSAASGGKVLRAHLTQGAKSYVDLVVEVPAPRNCRITAAVGGLDQKAEIQVSAAAVVNDARQAAAGMPLPGFLARFKGAQVNEGYHEQDLGVVRFDKPGLWIIRFMMVSSAKTELSIDKLRFQTVEEEPDGFKGYSEKTDRVNAERRNGSIRITEVIASDIFKDHTPGKVCDAVVSDQSRWIGGPDPWGKTWLELHFTQKERVGRVTLHSGYGDQQPIEDFYVEFKDAAGNWATIPASVVSGNSFLEKEIAFDDAKAVETDALRLVITKTPGDLARIKEVLVWKQ